MNPSVFRRMVLGFPFAHKVYRIIQLVPMLHSPNGTDLLMNTDKSLYSVLVCNGNLRSVLEVCQ